MIDAHWFLTLNRQLQETRTSYILSFKVSHLFQSNDTEVTILCMVQKSKTKNPICWIHRFAVGFVSWLTFFFLSQMPMPSPYVVTRVERVLRPLCVSFTVVHSTDRRGEGQTHATLARSGGIHLFLF